MKYAIRLGLIVLMILLLCLAVSPAVAEGTELTYALAGKDDTEGGFVCVETEDGKVYWQTGLDTFEEVVRICEVSDGAVYAKVAVQPDNEEEYKYLYPEEGWKGIVFESDIPSWFDESAVTSAFDAWKEEVYGQFDYKGLRTLSAQTAIDASPASGYVLTDEEIAACRDIAVQIDSHVTYLRDCIGGTIQKHLGNAIKTDCWSYCKSELGKLTASANINGHKEELHEQSRGVDLSNWASAVMGQFFDFDEWEYYTGSAQGYPYKSAVTMFEHGIYMWYGENNTVWHFVAANGGEILLDIPDAEVTPKQAFACLVDESGKVYWQTSADLGDTLVGIFGDNIHGKYVTAYVKPALTLETATQILPDGQDPTIDRCFPYLDDASVWTLTFGDGEKPDWFTGEMETSVLAACDEWRSVVYTGLDFKNAKNVFSAEKKAGTTYTDEDLKLLRQWAQIIYDFNQQGVDPECYIKSVGQAQIGVTMWTTLDDYFIAEWRLQYTECMGSIVKYAYQDHFGLDRNAKNAGANNVADSMCNMEAALVGYFYKNIDWGTEDGSYPYACGVDLLIKGLIPCTDGTNWYLETGENANIIYLISEAELLGL